jgi:hypothetical protein
MYFAMYFVMYFAMYFVTHFAIILLRILMSTLLRILNVFCYVFCHYFVMYFTMYFVMYFAMYFVMYSATDITPTSWQAQLSRYSDLLRAERSVCRSQVCCDISAPVHTSAGDNQASYTIASGSFPELKWL